MGHSMILCCGEALIDMIPIGADPGAGFLPHVGGAIFNTAIAMGRLGAPVGLFSGLSTDFFGDLLLSKLQESNVTTTLCPRSNKPTTLAFVQLSNGSAEYTFYDENSAGRTLSELDLPDLSKEMAALYFGGISLCNDPAATTLWQLASDASKDRVIVLDPNIRPGFIEDSTRHRQRLENFLAISDVVKVSDEDLHWLLPEDQSTDAAVQRLIDMGPGLVVLTCADAGAWAYTRAGTKLHVPAQRVAVVDTVGAGDTFNAGLMMCLMEKGLMAKNKLKDISELQLKSCLEFATKVAAVTVSRQGANPPWREELQ